MIPLACATTGTLFPTLERGRHDQKCRPQSDLLEGGKAATQEPAQLNLGRVTTWRRHPNPDRQEVTMKQRAVRLFFRRWWKHQTYQTHPRRTDLTNAPKFIGNLTALLIDPDYLVLSASERGMLHGLMILASYDAGHIDSDPKRIRAVLHLTNPIKLDVYDEWLVECQGVCKHMPSGWTDLGQRCASLGPDHNVKENVKEKVQSTGATAPTADKPPRKLTDYQVCIGRFEALHRQVMKLPYMQNHPRDNKALAPLLKTYGLKPVLEMIGYFWAEHRDRENGNEAWIGKAAPSVPGFVKVIPIIIRDYTVESYHPVT